MPREQTKPNTAGTTAEPPPQPADTPQAAPADAADNRLPLRPLLKFVAPAYERRFTGHYVGYYFRYAQASLVLGLLLVIGDYLVDHYALPAVASNVLRLQLCLPLLGAGVAYSFTPGARRHWQWAMSGVIVTMACCLFWILLRIDTEGGNGLKSWVGILNFTFLQFYCFVILGVQFRHALASGTLIITAFESALWADPGLSAGEVAYWSYHVVTLFMLAAGIGWWREYLLRKEFAARTALDEARESALQLARVKGEFLATMSHEIRTPMNGVLGMNELLIDSDLQPQQRAWAEGVQSSGRHLLGVINDILDFSKAESGRMELDAADFCVVDIVEEAASMFAQPAAGKGLELALQFEPQVAQLAVRGDPFRLRQVIANLVSNAIKFTAEGEVVVRVGFAGEISAQTAGPIAEQTSGHVMLELSVRDTGIGIAPQAQARIFENFAQADGSTTRRHGGTGLGLAICKRLLELMGGSVRVQSTPGQGSTFHVALRLPRAASAASAAAASPVDGSLAGVRVLVVDDNATSRGMLQQHLQGFRLRASGAASGAEALRLIEQAAQRQQPYALALLDAQMPGIDGLQLAQAIQALANVPSMKLVMLGTARAGGDAPRQRLAGLAVDATASRAVDEAASPPAWVDKPVRRAELLRVVSSALAAPKSGSAGQPLPAADGRARLRGHVLLVEDNAINQLLATAMLTRLGLSLDLAVDGAQAVAMVRDGHFDLVLMDCQMPVMDGFEATRRIRSWQAAEGSAQRPLPIIALTANAMAGDREACAAAGMSGYLSKPFSAAALVEVLAQHLEAALPPLPAAAAAALPIRPPAAPVRTPQQPVFDAAVLDELPMVADGSDPAFAWSVLDQFLQGSAQTLQLCRPAAAEAANGTDADHATVLRAVHTLKSTSAQVGALALAACAGAIEDGMRAGRQPGADGWAALQAAHRQAAAAITLHLSQVRDPAAQAAAADCPA